MGGLGSSPTPKMGGFQSGASLKNKKDFGTKNNKETYFLKGGSFGAVQVGKVEQINVHFWKGGLLELSRLKN